MSNNDELAELGRKIIAASHSDDEKEYRRLLARAKVLIEKIPDENERELQRKLLLEHPTIHKHLSQKNYPALFEHVGALSDLVKQSNLQKKGAISTAIEAMFFNFAPGDRELSLRMQLFQVIVEDYIKECGKLPMKRNSKFDSLVNALAEQQDELLTNPYTSKEDWPTLEAVENLDGILLDELKHRKGSVRIFVDGSSTQYLIVGFDKNQSVLSHQRGQFLLRNIDP